MADSTFEYLAGSELRPAVLSVLRAETLPLREVTDRVSASRRTVKRTLSEMESRGWIRPADGAYELTALGKRMLTAHEAFRERIRTGTRLQPFLEHVPASAFDLDLDFDALSDATVTTSNGDPTVIVDRLVSLRAEATRIYEYTPYLLLGSVRQFADLSGGSQPTPDVTLVVGIDTPPRSSPEYTEGFETLVTASDTDVRHYPDGPPFGFGVVDGCAFLGTADAQGTPHALIESDAPEVVSWVERRFAACLDAAEPLPE